MRWVLAVLAAVALTAGVVAAYADRAVFDADGFADRVDATLRSEPVSAELGGRLTDAVIQSQPDLVAVRPLIASAAETIVRGAAFRSLARAAARDVHRSVFDRDAGTVTLTVVDTGVLVSEALARLRPDLARSIPVDVEVRISAAAGDAETAAVEIAAFAERVRHPAVIGLVAFALLAGLAVVRGAPAWLLRLPVWVRAVAAIALGAALLLEPLATLELAAMAAGLLLVVAGASELLRLAGDPPAARLLRIPRGARIAAVSGVLLAGVAAVAVAAGDDPEPVFVGRCNGSADLCDRRLDQVSFVGTHNSMSADGEPGWLFAAQDAGIDEQLRDGIRSLLIDTHYGYATPRGVATDLTRDSMSRAKIESEVGPRFVETAQRLRARIGYTGGGTREIFLCHAFCEVGATPALEALEGVHRFLVEHPEEVLILSVEDDTEAADTAKLIRDSGLIREVYRGSTRPPWPTLRVLIERDERVLVLIENEPGPAPWMHEQSEVAQETPYHFGTAAALGADDSCRPNRGGTAGSLLLVNHWVDTSPAPRTSIASEVNARSFLTRRLARCRRERGLVPNVVAVDFYRQGDVVGTLAAER